MSTSSITVRHNFETGHRLPFLGGSCENLHGHSWATKITVEAPYETGVVVEFGAFKKSVREWIDTFLDHGLMLGHADPLVDVLSDYGKVFVFTPEDGDWPTVENVARLLADRCQRLLEKVPRAADSRVVHVQVSETAVNAAHWRRD